MNEYLNLASHIHKVFWVLFIIQHTENTSLELNADT